MKNTHIFEFNTERKNEPEPGFIIVGKRSTSKKDDVLEKMLVIYTSIMKHVAKADGSKAKLILDALHNIDHIHNYSEVTELIRELKSYVDSDQLSLVKPQFNALIEELETLQKIYQE